MSSATAEDAAGTALVQDTLPGELAELYHRYGPAAYRLAVHRVHDRDLAADVVQEAFLSLWRSRHTFAADRGSVGGLLGTLVHRRAVELLRRRASWPATELLDEQHAETLADATAGPEQLACDADQQARVLAALDRLPPAKRQALQLVWLYDHRAADIAGPLGIPRGTAKTRILTARSQLRHILPRAALD